jgi:hypothetical protein
LSIIFRFDAFCCHFQVIIILRGCLSICNCSAGCAYSRTVRCYPVLPSRAK